VAKVRIRTVNDVYLLLALKILVRLLDFNHGGQRGLRVLQTSGMWFSLTPEQTTRQKSQQARAQF
jgi:hypothetical protein